MFALIILISTSSAMRFDCKYEMYFFFNIGSIYTCRHNFSRKGDSLIISSVSNHVEPSKNNSQVKGFSIRSQVWDRVPRALRIFFPNLEALEMVATELREITWEDFEGLPKLKHLNFMGNELQTLDGSIFQSIPHLHTIRLSQNPLRHINLKTFIYSKELKAIYLTNSNCIDQDIKEPTKEDIKELIDQLQIRCPPSSEMMQRNIIDSPELRRKINDQIDIKTAPIEKELYKIIQNINKMENRLTYMEPAIPANHNRIKRKIRKNRKIEKR